MDLSSVLNASHVAVAAGVAGYPDAPPFSPDRHSAEYPFGSSNVSSTPNPTYGGVRRALSLLG